MYLYCYMNGEIQRRVGALIGRMSNVLLAVCSMNGRMRFLWMKKLIRLCFCVIMKLTAQRSCGLLTVKNEGVFTYESE